MKNEIFITALAASLTVSTTSIASASSTDGNECACCCRGERPNTELKTTQSEEKQPNKAIEKVMLIAGNYFFESMSEPAAADEDTQQNPESEQNTNKKVASIDTSACPEDFRKIWTQYMNLLDKGKNGPPESMRIEKELDTCMKRYMIDFEQLNTRLKELYKKGGMEKIDPASPDTWTQLEKIYHQVEEQLKNS